MGAWRRQVVENRAINSDPYPSTKDCCYQNRNQCVGTVNGTETESETETGANGEKGHMQ